MEWQTFSNWIKPEEPFPWVGRPPFHLGKEEQSPTAEMEGARPSKRRCRAGGDGGGGWGLGDGELKPGHHHSAVTTSIKLL